MKKKKLNDTLVWRLRVPRELVDRVQEIADQERRPTTQQVIVLLEQALRARIPVQPYDDAS